MVTEPRRNRTARAVIPAEAVEAAAKVLNLYVSDDFDAIDTDGQMTRDAAKEILEAAAPHMP